MIPWLMFRQLLSQSPNWVDGPVPAELANGTDEEFESSAEKHDAAVQSKGALGTRVAITKSATGSVQWLPYKDNVVTWMKLDKSAEWFFTAQISGCHFYAVKVGAETWAFHANLNKSSTDLKLNMKLKDDMCRGVLGTKAYTLTHMLRRDTIKSDDIFRPTMVFGLNNNGWRFYAHAWSCSTFTGGMPYVGRAGYEAKNCKIIHPYLDLACAAGTTLT